MPFKEGHTSYYKGKHHTEETRRRMSIAHKKSYKNGRIPAFKGKHFSEEHKRNLSLAQKKRFAESPHPRLGAKLTQEHKDIISKVNKGRKLTQEHIERRSATLKANIEKRTGEHRSQGLLRYYQENQVWNKGLSWSQEIRDKIREGCLNSSVGMGPKGPWKYVNDEQHQQEEVIV